MPKLNLKKVVVVDDKDGNPQGFGPGKADVPNELYEAHRRRFDRATVPSQTDTKRAGE